MFRRSDKYTMNLYILNNLENGFRRRKENIDFVSFEFKFHIQIHFALTEKNIVK